MIFDTFTESLTIHSAASATAGTPAVVNIDKD